MNLGETILRLRTGRGMSQEDLAAALEVSRQSVSKWETNASVPELDKLIKLGALFDVTLDELVTGEKKESPAPEPPEPAPPSDPPRQVSAAISTAQRVIGWLLVSLAAVVCLLFIILTQSLWSVLFALPFLGCGVICLTVRRDAGLWCAWTLLGCVDLYVRYATGITWGMILLPQAYAWGMYVQLACAWGEALFMAALIFITAARFRKRPVEQTRRNRMRFAAGAAALVLLSTVPYWMLRALLPDHMVVYRLLIVLLDWVRLALLTALITAAAQGIWKKPKA